MSLTIDISSINDAVKFVFTNAIGDTNEFEFDMQDAEDATKYFAAAERMQKAHVSMPKDVDVIEDIHNFCEVVRDFFDEIFGEGAGRKLIPKDNRRHVMLVHAAFLKFVADQNSTLTTFLEDTTKKTQALVTETSAKLPTPKDHLPPKLPRGRQKRVQ